MKKFRGKRRYFRKLWSKVSTYKINVDDDSWFDFWHVHLDFFGMGNNSMKVRREHIKAHLALYKNLLKQLEDFNKPYQAWICIHEEDSGSDAVYVHTPNPNYDDFPLNVGGIDWSYRIPNTLKDLIDTNLFKVGYYRSDIEEICYIQSRIHGVPL